MSENVSKLQQLYAAFGRGEINAILDNVTDDVTWGAETAVATVPWYELREGRSGVADFFSMLAQEVEFKRFEPSIWAESGDQIFVRIDYESRYKHNGKGLAGAAVHQFTIRDGKIAKFRAFEDTATVREAWNG